MSQRRWRAQWLLRSEFRLPSCSHASSNLDWIFKQCCWNTQRNVVLSVSVHAERPQSSARPTSKL